MGPQRVTAQALTVGEIARLAGVSVGTLHHYDEVGLLHPGDRSPAGYRLYRGADVDRLQAVLAYRELGFDLERIRVLLDDPDVDAMEHMRRQHALLLARLTRIRRIVAAIETAMEETTMGTTRLTPAEKLEVFGDFDPDEHAAEAEQRWGGEDAYAESARRTRSYTKEQWRQATAELRAGTERLAEVMRSGAAPTSTAAMDAAEAARVHITRWYYDCSPQMHRDLGDMSVTDARFSAHYEDVEPGLAQFVRDAIHTNADRHAG